MQPPDAYFKIGPHHAGVLRQFFAELSADPEAVTTFHPHPFTADYAQKVADYAGRDYYCGAMVGDSMVAYGILRGWDEGYEIPSLGVAVAASHRGRGIGLGMMKHLHAVARDRGATTIRLKVYKANTAATELYRQLGYELSELNEHEWLGLLDLRHC